MNANLSSAKGTPRAEFTLNIMLKTFIILFSTFGLLASINQERPDFKTFFTEFRTAAAEKNVEKLKTLVYPFKNDVEDMQAGLIKMTLNGNVNQDGDGAFSLKALDVLIEKHLDKITLIPEKLYKQLSGDPIMGNKLQQIGMERTYIFDHNGAHIILFNTKKDSIQLFFWENLNRLLDGSHLQGGVLLS